MEKVQRLRTPNGGYLVRDNSNDITLLDKNGVVVTECVAHSMWDHVMDTLGVAVEQGVWVDDIWVADYVTDIVESVVEKDGRVRNPPNIRAMSVVHRGKFIEIANKFTEIGGFLLVPNKYRDAVQDLHPTWVECFKSVFKLVGEDMVFIASLGGEGIKRNLPEHHIIYGPLPTGSEDVFEIVECIKNWNTVVNTVFRVY